jgi:hypothetical protein
LTQLDLFAEPAAEVIFPGRTCLMCIFCDYTSNGHSTYPFGVCHCPSYSTATPATPERTLCMATRYPDDNWMSKVQQRVLDEVCAKEVVG